MHVLIVEDDRKVSNLLCQGLQEAGFTVDLADSVSAGTEATDAKRYDLLILDRGLPDGDGCEIIGKARATGKDIPVILLTARDSVDDRITGLDSGADDYVVKPFAFSELLARIRALLRRASSGDSLLLKIADIEVDLVARRVKRDGDPVDLRPREYDLLVYLLRNAGHPVSRDALAREVWHVESPAIPMDNVIDVHISHLRDKIDRGRENRLLRTIRGVGFVLGRKAS